MLDRFESIYKGFIRDEASDFLDKVDLEIIIHKLKRYGFHSRRIELIKLFFFDRDPVVVLDAGVHSE